MLFAITVLYTGIAVAFLATQRQRWMLNPAVIFIAQQAVFFLGVAPLIEPEVGDLGCAYIFLAAEVLFILGFAMAEWVSPVRVREARAWYAAKTETAGEFRLDTYIFALMGLAVAVCALYYAAVGYNVFTQFLGNWLAGGGHLSVQEVASERLNAYGGSRYLAAGYVDQFKNVILPLLTAYLYVRYRLTRHRRDRLIVLVAAPLSVVYLLGTGQRWPIFLALCVTGPFAYIALPRRQARRVGFGVFLVCVAFLVISSVALGRTTRTLDSTSDVESVARELGQRFVSDNQVATVLGYRLVAHQPPLWLNGEWAQGLASLIPGHARNVTAGLSHEIFYELFLDPRGTAPPSLWVVVWNDFGIFGVLVVPFLLGIFHQRIYSRVIHGPKSLARVAIYTNATVVLGLWAVAGPDAMANDGLATLAILAVAVKLIAQRARSRRALLAPSGQSAAPLRPRAGRHAWVAPGPRV